MTGCAPNRQTAIVSLVWTIFLFVTVSAGATVSPPTPLAIVGPDTLTTTDLKIELGIMINQKDVGDASTLPKPDQVLRRLVQNRLIVQEGYRMGLHEEFVITNQVFEFIRHQTMTALLDSVTAAVPKTAGDMHEARRLAVGDYLADLRERFGVSVDTALLATLDYGSADPQMQEYLRNDTTVLATVPTGQLTVAAFSRNLRFTEYHGLVDKPDADKKRDKAFEAWLAEVVLYHQVGLQKMTELPRYTVMAERMERNLVLQEGLRMLLDFDFSPTASEIETYYQANLAQFTAEPRVKMESLKVGSNTAAEKLMGEMKRGVPVNWLRKNNENVVKGPPPFPLEFFEPAKLGLNQVDMQIGFIPEPYQVPSGWVVAIVVDIEEPAPKALAQCQNELLAMMKSGQTRDLMIEILDRLEVVAPITILPDAEVETAKIIQRFGTDRAKAVEAVVPTTSQEG